MVSPNDHFGEDDDPAPITLTEGVMEVHELGSAGLAGRPDIAAQALDIFTEAVESAGGEMDGLTLFRGPAGIRELRPRRPNGAAG